jgi:hypothetical protein
MKIRIYILHIVLFLIVYVEFQLRTDRKGMANSVIHMLWFLFEIIHNWFFRNLCSWTQITIVLLRNFTSPFYQCGFSIWRDAFFLFVESPVFWHRSHKVCFIWATFSKFSVSSELEFTVKKYFLKSNLKISKTIDFSLWLFYFICCYSQSIGLNLCTV